MGVKKVNDWMQPTAKLIAFIVCITAINSPHYCTPTALQSQNSCFSPIFFPDLQLAGEYNNASSASYCEESEMEDEVSCSCTGNIH